MTQISQDIYKKIRSKMNKDHKWTGNILRYYAEELMLYPAKDEEIVRYDMTEKFFKELEREIMQREIWKIQINAKPRLGKSTEGIELMKFGDRLLKKYFPEQALKEEIGMRNIARDDQEYTRKMRNPDLMFDVILVDENNALEDTGENATTEKAQREVFSDVQAGRYVHTIYVCPEKVMDKNSDIKLEIRNKEKGLIHNYLYYKVKESWILLGYVDIDVSELISNWNKVESVFYRYLKNKDPKDKDIIEKWTKKDFYVEYMCKKYEKMELMNREGILRPRELDYAGVVLNVVEKTKGLAMLMSPNQLRLPIQSYVEMEYKKQKIPYSIIGADGATRRIMGILISIRTLKDIERKIQITKLKRKEGKYDEKIYNENMIILEKNQEEVNEMVNVQMNELKRYAEINKKYNEHL